MALGILAFLTAIMPAIMQGISIYLEKRREQEDATDALVERDVAVWGGPPTDRVPPADVLRTP